MKQVHCLINCIAYTIRTKADYRPLFFGSWNSPFGETGNGTITYCPELLSSIKQINITKSLYNSKVRLLYDKKRDKESNFNVLKHMINLKDDGQSDLIQIDTFYLPSDTINYRKHHFPHFIIINSFKNGTWHINDPYNDWEGELEQDIVRNAVVENNYSGWFRIDTHEVKEPAAGEIIKLFEDDFTADNFTLIDHLKKYLGKIEKNITTGQCRKLAGTIAQYAILYKTKSSYEYAFGYFSEKLNIKSDVFVSGVNNYLKEWNTLTFKLLKFSISEKAALLQNIFGHIDGMYQLEKEIKSQLKMIYDKWKSKELNRCRQNS